MESPFNQKKVCIVDDDPNIREIYGMTFKQNGFDVLYGENGEIGLQQIRTHKPAAILLDLQMPVKDGLTTLKELKADPELSKIPVVILSNQDDESSFKAVGELDATKFYIVKAISTPQKAVNLVKEALH